MTVGSDVRGPSTWAGKGQPYSRSFANLAAGRGARVTAVDPDAEMLSLARAAAPKAALCVGAVPGLPFERGTFDAVVANFVVNHVGDPRAAVADLMRVCVPNGVVGVTVWPSALSAINALWADVVRASGAITHAPQLLPPDKDFDRTEHGLAELLAGAGLSRVEATTLTWEFRIDGSYRQWFATD